jgi:hypothetical protein
MLHWLIIIIAVLVLLALRRRADPSPTFRRALVCLALLLIAAYLATLVAVTFGPVGQAMDP